MRGFMRSSLVRECEGFRFVVRSPRNESGKLGWMGSGFGGRWEDLRFVAGSPRNGIRG